MTSSLLAFLPVIVLLVLVPGANNVVVLRQTLVAGARGGAAATAGASVGILVWAGVVAAGVGSLVERFPDAWTVVRWLGAATLVALGVRSVLLARRATAGGVSGPTVRRSFLTALGTSLGNPRAGVSAVALLPQFVEPGTPTATTIVALGLLWALCAAAWNLLGVAVVRHSRRFLEGPRVMQVTETVAGALLVLVGVSVGLQ